MVNAKFSKVNSLFINWSFPNKKYTIGGFKGAPGTPPGPNSFIFMPFSAKIDKIIPIWELAHPFRENPGSATVYRYNQWSLEKTSERYMKEKYTTSNQKLIYFSAHVSTHEMNEVNFILKIYDLFHNMV